MLTRYTSRHRLRGAASVAPGLLVAFVGLVTTGALATKSEAVQQKFIQGAIAACMVKETLNGQPRRLAEEWCDDILADYDSDPEDEDGDENNGENEGDDENDGNDGEEGGEGGGGTEDGGDSTDGGASDGDGGDGDDGTTADPGLKPSGSGINEACEAEPTTVGCTMPDGTIFAGISPCDGSRMFVLSYHQGTNYWADNTKSTNNTDPDQDGGTSIEAVNWRHGAHDLECGRDNTYKIIEDPDSSVSQDRFDDHSTMEHLLYWDVNGHEGYSANYFDGSVDSYDDAPGNYAADDCGWLGAAGHSDWYLPARDELEVMAQNAGAIGGFSNSLGRWWSSTELFDVAGDDEAYHVRIDDDGQGGAGAQGKWWPHYGIRCVRNDSTAYPKTID